MTAAAASRRLHVPRRRPLPPAAWERVGAVSGVVGVAALVIAACVTIRLRDRLPHLVFGSGAADIVHASTAPVLVVPAWPEGSSVAGGDGDSPREAA